MKQIIYTLLFFVFSNSQVNAQLDNFESQDWQNFIQELSNSDTVIAIGSHYGSPNVLDMEMFRRIIVLYRATEYYWEAIKIDVFKDGSEVSNPEVLPNQSTEFIKKNTPDLMSQMNLANSMVEEMSKGNPIQFFIKVNSEVVYSNYFNGYPGGISGFVDDDKLSLLFMYYSIGNNRVP